MAVISSIEVHWQGECRRRGMPMGLKNLGNTCYLNSVLQCLTYTPPLANFCLRNQHSRQCTVGGVCPFCLLENRIACSLTDPAPVGSPARIYKCLLDYAKHFRQGRQEDAHEFLRYAIDACDSICKKLGKTVELRTAMKDIFGGSVQSQIRCISCNAESCKLDTILDLSLDILGGVKSLKEALGKFFQQELLDGNNKYQCEACQRLTVAKKKMSVYEAPNVLVIQLKRFENVFGGKIDRHLQFEEKLTLAPYMSEKSKDYHPDYHLYAVIVHSGFTQYGGHYYAYVKDSRGKWFCCNDSFVSAVDSCTVLAEKVYILFYVRSVTVVRAPSSATSTPSPPPTPDPVTVKPSTTSTGSNKVYPESVAKERSQLRFQIHNTARTKALANKANAAPATPARVGLERRQAEGGPAGTPAPSLTPCIGAKRQREDSSVEELENRLKEVRASVELLEFTRRLEKSCCEALTQHGWCAEVRESLRGAKRCKNESGNMINEVREASLRKVPVAVKEQLVSELRSFYMTQNL